MIVKLYVTSITRTMKKRMRTLDTPGVAMLLVYGREIDSIEVQATKWQDTLNGVDYPDVSGLISGLQKVYVVPENTRESSMVDEGWYVVEGINEDIDAKGKNRLKITLRPYDSTNVVIIG